MKNLLLLLAALTLLAPAAPVAQEKPAAQNAAPLAAERDPGAWREYASPQGRFAVLVPGDMTLNTQQLPTPDGKGVTLHIHSLGTSAEYGVIHADYPFEVSGAEMRRRLLDDGARGAVESVGAQLLEAKEISLGEHPGRALKELMRDGRVMHARMYLVGSRLYQVAVTLPKLDAADPATAFAEETAAKFLDSFRLLDAAAQEGEVDRLLKELRAKGEAVYGVKDDAAGGSTVEPATKVAGGTINARAASLPQPDYPPIARAARAAGTVVVHVVADEEGRVVAAQAASGHPLLQAAAVKAARQARFKSALVNGKPVKIVGAVSYNFILQ